MFFNSIEFLIFLPIVFSVFWMVNRLDLNVQNIVVVIASYVFYGWWDWRFLSLILISTVIDYSVGIEIGKSSHERKRKLLLISSIVVNLGFLGFFKYYNFFVDSFVQAFTLFGVELNPGTLDIVLPVGISFYTFQTLSYTIDVYRRKLEPTTNFIAFAAFVSFFPQLVAGPIERATHLLPQFHQRKKLSYEILSKGVKLIIWGMFLKIVVADRAGLYVDAVYNNVEAHEGLTFIAATVMFAFQIYGDFAGYSLIAIGTARLFDFDLMTNFRRPYFAKSVSEFWQRWHISLSTWFRDYLYIPLGGNRRKKPRWLFNLFITFLISGLWHGANWTFVAWGAVNGLYLIFEVLLFKERRRNVFNIALTFILINIAWIFFRANDIGDAIHVIKMIFTHPGKFFIGSGSDVMASLYATLAILLLVLVEFKREYFENRFNVFSHKNEWVRIGAYAFVTILIFYLGVFGKSQFIYFQF